MLISEIKQDKLVNASIDYLKVLDEVYGSEIAMAAWSKLADVVDSNLSGMVFSAMLRGGTRTSLVIETMRDNADPIAIVKYIRKWDYTEPTLRDAKQKLDILRSGGTVTVPLRPGKWTEAREDFLSIGAVV